MPSRKRLLKRRRADKYEILIDAPSDQVAIDRDEVSIQSGETIVATIRQVQRSSSSQALDGLDTSIPRVASQTQSELALLPGELKYNDRSLAQWLDILARDLDGETRAAALKAIRTLTTREQRPQVTRRLIEIARASNIEQWSNFRSLVKVVKLGRREQSAPSLDSSLVNLLIRLNGDTWFASCEANGLFSGDDEWTARWLAAMLKQIDFVGTADRARLMQYFRDSEKFNALGPNTAVLAAAWLQLHLGTSEATATADSAACIERIEQQRHLGPLAVLQMDGELEFRFRAEGSFYNTREQITVTRARIIVEEAVATYAKGVLADENSSPEAVARAASRLASTTEIVESWKPELAEVLRQRLAVLAADRDRLLTMLPIEPELRRAGFQDSSSRLPFSLIPVVSRFRAGTDEAQQLNQGQFGQSVESVNSVGMAFRREAAVPPYIESEGLALIALVIRLGVASECERELAEVYSQTQADYEAMDQLGIHNLAPGETLPWPYDMQRASEPWASIATERWLGWALLALSSSF